MIAPETRRVVGMDVFIEDIAAVTHPEQLGANLAQLVAGTPVALKAISNRGTKVYPPTGAITDNTDQFAARFMLTDANGDLSDADLLQALQRIGTQYRWSHIEKLQVFDTAQGFTKSQGED
jgi:isocitrate dehydrogenase